MRRFFVLPFTLTTLVLWIGCATPFEVVQLPERSADLYPLSLTQWQTTVAADEIRDPDRARRYFGVDLLEQDIVPVSIVVSNHGDRPVRVKPADILLHRGNEIIDPLPVAQVAALAREQGRLNRQTREQVDAYYREIAFRATAVGPHDTYQGVLFFPMEDPKGRRNDLFRRVSLWMQGDMELDVVVETADRDERLRFGPFTLTGPSRDDWF